MKNEDIVPKRRSFPTYPSKLVGFQTRLVRGGGGGAGTPGKWSSARTVQAGLPDAVVAPSAWPTVKL